MGEVHSVRRSQRAGAVNPASAVAGHRISRSRPTRSWISPHSPACDRGDRRAQNRAVFAEHDEAVHLAGDNRSSSPRADRLTVRHQSSACRPIPGAAKSS
jgi:hypothetical protein